MGVGRVNLMTTATPKEYSSKITVIRFLAVIMVLFWHSNNLTFHLDGRVHATNQPMVTAVETFISAGLVRVSTPLLFAISGFLFFRNYDGRKFGRWFGAKLKTRAQTLLAPYLFWSAWGLLAVFLMQQVPAARPFFYTTLIADYTPSRLLNTLFLNPFPYQLWFLRDLMAYVLLTPLIYPCLKWGRWLLPVVLLALWLGNVPLVIVSPEGLFFYVLGGWLAQNPQPIGPFNWPSLAVWLCGLWIITCAASAVQADLSGQVNNWLQNLGILCGVAGVWLIYDQCLARFEARLDAWAQYTFFLFVAHEPVLTVFKKTLLKFLGHSEISMLAAYFIAPTLAIIAVLTAGVVLHRFLPRFYSFISGHR